VKLSKIFFWLAVLTAPAMSVAAPNDSVIIMNCPETLTCHANPYSGDAIHAGVECKSTAETEVLWKFYKINENYTPSTLIDRDPDHWTMLPFSGAFLPAEKHHTSNIDRPRCSYGIYDPYVPYFVSVTSMTGRAYTPLAGDDWHLIKDQYHHDLYVCESTATHCKIKIES
jgi:hypothetical protein